MTIEMCPRADNACQPHSCLSLHSSNEQVSWDTDDLPASAFSDTTDAVTLANVIPTRLAPLMHRRLEPMLAEVEIRTLGVILTSALLQLYATTWLSDGWSTADIVLVGCRRAAGGSLAFTDVYISKTFASQKHHMAGAGEC
jgi:hypothetical protein